MAKLLYMFTVQIIIYTGRLEVLGLFECDLRNSLVSHCLAFLTLSSSLTISLYHCTHSPPTLYYPPYWLSPYTIRYCLLSPFFYGLLILTVKTLVPLIVRDLTSFLITFLLSYPVPFSDLTSYLPSDIDFLRVLFPQSCLLLRPHLQQEMPDLLKYFFYCVRVASL